MQAVIAVRTRRARAAALPARIVRSVVAFGRCGRSTGARSDVLIVMILDPVVVVSVRVVVLELVVMTVLARVVVVDPVVPIVFVRMVVPMHMEVGSRLVAVVSRTVTSPVMATALPARAVPMRSELCVQA